ncbi:MAG: DUF1684 domain-containing protein [Rhodothermales bacterium]
MRSLLFLLLAGACACTLGACASTADPPALPPVPERVTAWEAWRAAKDSLFRSPATPLLPTQQGAFRGLPYFDYDSTLAFAVTLDPTLQRDTLRMATSTGEPRDYVRFGSFSFPFDGRRHRLAVFQPLDPNERRLFLPFADATSGGATYSAGRYLDFDPAPDGRYVLDFNYAYSPYCAYNPSYSCPLPPPENRLPIAVRAGERNATSA